MIFASPEHQPVTLSTGGPGAISRFKDIPNKRVVEHVNDRSDLWPDLGSEFVLNQFYRHFSGAEGWLGEGYLAVWTKHQVLEFREPNLEVYPEKYHFFASNGGGTQFGFFVENETVSFIAAPDIGDEKDIRILGSWSDFLKSLQNADYI